MSARYCIICGCSSQENGFIYGKGCFVCAGCDGCGRCGERVGALALVNAKTDPRILCSECIMIMAHHKFHAEYQEEIIADSG